MTRVVCTKTWEDKIGTNRDENWAAFFMKSNWMTGQWFYLSNGIRTPKPRETPLASFLYVCFPIHLSEALLFRAKLWHLGCLSRKSSVFFFLSSLVSHVRKVWAVLAASNLSKILPQFISCSTSAFSVCIILSSSILTYSFSELYTFHEYII